MYKKGQVTIGWVIGFLATTLVAASSSMIGATYAASKDTDRKLEVVADQVRQTNTQQDKDIAALKEAVSTIKDDSGEMKRDIKELLRRTK